MSGFKHFFSPPAVAMTGDEGLVYGLCFVGDILEEGRLEHSLSNVKSTVKGVDSVLVLGLIAELSKPGTML